MPVKDLYYQKYLKYKNKYLNLQNQLGGLSKGTWSEFLKVKDTMTVTKDSVDKHIAEQTFLPPFKKRNEFFEDPTKKEEIKPIILDEIERNRRAFNITQLELAKNYLSIIEAETKDIQQDFNVRKKEYPGKLGIEFEELYNIAMYNLTNEINKLKKLVNSKNFKLIKIQVHKIKVNKYIENVISEKEKIIKKMNAIKLKVTKENENKIIKATDDLNYKLSIKNAFNTQLGNIIITKNKENNIDEYTKAIENLNKNIVKLEEMIKEVQIKINMKNSFDKIKNSFDEIKIQSETVNKNIEEVDLKKREFMVLIGKKDPGRSDLLEPEDSVSNVSEGSN